MSPKNCSLALQETEVESFEPELHLVKDCEEAFEGSPLKEELVISVEGRVTVSF